MRRSIVLLSIAVALASCTSRGDGRSSSPSSGRALKVAFLEDLSLENATSMVVPAFQGAKLAIDAASRSGLGVELVAEDTGGDPARAVEIARRLAADPSVIAVIVGPYLTGLDDAASILNGAGMRVASLAVAGPDPVASGLTTWLQAVAGQADEARAIASQLDALAAGGPVCLGASSSAEPDVSTALSAMVERPATISTGNGSGPVGTGAMTGRVADAGCSVLFWGGSGPEVARVRLWLDAAGLEDITLVGAEEAKDPSFLAAAGTAGDGTLVACACADLTTWTSLAARRFIQNFQADFGLPPGPYAAEAWDVAEMLLVAIRGGARTRSGMLTFASAGGRYLGLTGSYAFNPDGSLMGARSKVNLYRDVGGRWIRISG
jgi:branched-chain amino acid transport system substrate-binding protein